MRRNVILAIGIFAAIGFASAAAAHDPVHELERAYRELNYYSDTTTSILVAETGGGEVFRNVNEYKVIFHKDQGALIDNFLGQLFLVSKWKSVTNWFKGPARYSVSRFATDVNWRQQFVPIGAMISTEHAGMSMLLDRRTNLSDGAFPNARTIDRRSIVDYDGKPAVLLEGGFFFSTQGINWDGTDATPVPGKLWVDASSGFLRKAEYDISAPYSKTFGAVSNAKLIITHDDINVTAPTVEDIDSLFSFTPRVTDVERNQAELFSVPAVNQFDDGFPNFLLYRPAPAFRGKALDGNNLSLADYRGERVLLFFWASWCPNSARAIGQIDELSKADIKRFNVIGVNVDSFVGRQALRSYYDKRGLSFTSILDKENLVTSMYRGIATPTIVIIDSSGIIRRMDLGETENLVDRYLSILGEIP